MKVFAADSGGATAIEYAMIAGMISIVIVGSVSVIGSEVTADFNQILAIWE